MQSLENRIGIVTGGSSGIGYAIANSLAEAGAKVYSISRMGREKEGLKKSHPNVIHLTGDVKDGATMKKYIDDIGRDQGIDFLVNNAGITLKKRAELFTDEEFKSIMEVNVNSVFNLCILCYPYLKQSTHTGRIINISSMAAHLGFSQVVPYCTSKGAVLGLTKGLAVEWAGDNIRINSIAPGWFPSEMSQQVMTPERKEAILNRMPLHQFGETKDLGEMALFLLGDGATYITGVDFAVDGGALAYGF